MSLLKKLKAPAPIDKIPQEEEDESCEESYSEISDSSKNDLRQFLEFLKEKERRMKKIEELSATQNKYYCQACDYACAKKAEIKAHQETEEHQQKDREWSRKQYKFGSFEKYKRRGERAKKRQQEEEVAKKQDVK